MQTKLFKTKISKKGTRTFICTKVLKATLLFLFLFSLPFLSIAQNNWGQIGQNINGESGGDKSGYSVATSSDGATVAIGAPWNDGNGNTSGHVRIYRVGTGGTWTQLGNDIDGEAAYDQSGHSVSLSSDGNTIAIGAPYNNGNTTEGGHVRIYNWDGSLWNQVGQDIDGIYTSMAATEFLGASVSLNSFGTIVAIGVPYSHTGSTPPGKTRVYQFNGNSWVQLGNDIIGGITSDRFGCSVSISSDGYTVAIGAPDDKGPGSSPKVRIFHWGGSSWVQIGADIDSYLSSFGESVSLSKDGNRVAIGSSGFIVSVYENNGGWAQLGQDIYTISTSVSVSINAIGDKLAIGCHTDQGFIYEYNTCGITNSWIQIGEIVGGYSLGGVGSLISISDGGDTVAIGSPGGNTGGSLARVYSYQCQLVLSATDICTGPSPTTGINTGSIDLSVTGGTGNYAYNWSNGSITEDISGLSNGIYTVIVTDLNDSCNCVADTLSITINCPDSCILNVSATDTCILDATTGITTGSISVSVTGGSNNYSYVWMSAGNLSGANLSGLANGTYTVMVEDNINTTCQNAYLTITIDCDTCIYGCTDPLAVNYNQFATCDDNSCFLPPLCVLTITATDTCILDPTTGITTGSISVSVTGGSNNYSYVWLSAGNLSGPNLSGLVNGTYTVMVEDDINLNCPHAYLTITIDCDTCIYGCTDPLVTNYNPNATCDDGSCIYPICDSIYPYLLNPGFENVSTVYFDDWYWSHGTPSVSTPFTGNYGVMMWSATLPQGGEGGEGLFTCFDFDTTKCYDISFWAKVNDTSLNATFDLFATSDLTQQSQNTGGGPIPSVVSEPIGSVPFSNIGTNWTYIEIPVYQPNGNNNQFWFYPNHPNSLIAAKIWVDEVHITEVSCDTCNIILSATDSCILDTVSGIYSGSIDLTVSGGSCYTYSWTGPGGPYTTEDLTGLADGTYCVTVYDCIDTACYDTICITIDCDTSCNLTLSATDTCLPYSCDSCYLTLELKGIPNASLNTTYSLGVVNQTINFSEDVSGGYLFLNNYVETDSIKLSCDSDNRVMFNLDNISDHLDTARIYICGTLIYELVYDENTSTFTPSIFYPFDTNTSISSFTSNFVGSWQAVLDYGGDLSLFFPSSGSDGSIDLTVSGGTAPYIYSWNNNNETTEDISGLADGSYCVTVTDASTPPCTENLCVTIDCDTCIYGCTDPLATNYNSLATCDDGSCIFPPSCDLEINSITNSCASCCYFKYEMYVSGFQAPDAYWQLTDLGTGSVIYQSPPLVGPDPASSGSNPIFYVDSFLVCTNSALEVEMFADPNGNGVSQSNGSAAPCLCFTTLRGWLCDSLIVYKNNSTFDPYGQQPPGIGNIPGIYTSLVTPPNIIGSNISGVLEANLSGGVSPFTYSWIGPNSFSASTKEIGELSDGIYCVTVTDANGCVDTMCTTVGCNTPCNLTLSTTDTCILDTVSGTYSGSIDLTVTGGTPPYTYSWDNGTLGFPWEDLSGLDTGTYCVTVTDASTPPCIENLCVTIACDTCIYGCTDPLAINYNSTATCDDGSCIYPTCDDPLACNYDECSDPISVCYDATSYYEASACTYAIGWSLGCTYIDAINYDPTATVDDGSCEYDLPSICGAGTYFDAVTSTCLPDGSGTGGGCLGDLDNDGFINTSDLLLFLAVFGSACP